MEIRMIATTRVDFVPLADIGVDLNNLARPELHEAAVQRYMDSFDALPAILLYRVDDRLWLADGHHRLEAAFRLHKATIRADVRDGTMEELLAAAFSANAQSGEPLTVEERDRCIVGLNAIRWSQERIGKVFGLSQTRVGQIIRAFAVANTISNARNLSTTVLDAIGAAPKEDWAALAEVVRQKHWDREETEAAARNLKDPRIGEDYRNRLRLGEAEPIAWDRDNQPGFLNQTLARVTRDARSGAYLGWLHLMERAAPLIATIPVSDLVHDVGPEDRADFERDVRRLRAYIEALAVELDLVSVR